MTENQKKKKINKISGLGLPHPSLAHLVDIYIYIYMVQASWWATNFLLF